MFSCSIQLDEKHYSLYLYINSIEKIKDERKEIAMKCYHSIKKKFSYLSLSFCNHFTHFHASSVKVGDFSLISIVWILIIILVRQYRLNNKYKIDEQFIFIVLCIVNTAMYNIVLFYSFDFRSNSFWAYLKMKLFT